MKLKSLTHLASLLPLLLLACGGAEGGGLEGETDQALRGCPTQKLEFTRDTGCQNDGSVEFCVPASDAALIARVQALDPEITFVPSGGRARCDTTTQLLALYPTRPGNECSGTRLRASAWRDLCRIAREPAVTRIVPTFFE